MQLVSRLRETTLGDLLAMMHREHATGVLELIEPHVRHAIHLRRGLVQAVESGTALTRLGDIAVREFGVSRAHIERARWFAGTHGLRIGQALVATGALHPVDVDSLLQVQQRTRLETLYKLRDAEVRFRVARPLPPGASEQNPLQPTDAYHSRPRRRGRTDREPVREPVRMPATASTRRHRSLAALGLGPAASRTEARAAFQHLVLQLHPDRSDAESPTQREEKTRRLSAVIAAWKEISNS